MIGTLFKDIVGSFHRSFENECFEILVYGYNELLKDPDFSLDWQETDISSQLVLYMRSLNISTKYKIDISSEYQINNKVLSKGQAKKNPRIDIRMMNWSQKDKKSFYIEAKNLCQNNWTKSTGTRVNSKTQTKAYVDEGVKRYIEEKYPYGCMVGYILNGHPDNITKNINSYINADITLGPINSKSTFYNHPYFYTSKNIINGKEIDIRHIFFVFSKN